jgi:nucleoside-diphosphate-sugar epimerase
MTAKYLVTGGAGFIGSHIAQTLLRHGQTVRVFDNFSSGREENLAALEGSVEVLRGDLRDLAAVRAAMEGVEVVFHEGAAASAPQSVADPLGSLEINVTGTQHVLLAARDAGVRRVVYASSSAIYGDSPLLPKEERMAPDPRSPYALHKLAGEHLCRLFTQLYGLETVALRYFNVFGPRQNPDSEYAAVVPRFLTLLAQGKRPTVFGDGEQTRDFIYIDDVVKANLLAAEAPAAVGQAINIGSGERMSLNELLALAGTVIGVEVQADYQESRPGDVRDSLASIQRAKDVLNFAPAVSFREGLALTLAALTRKQRKATHSA